MLNGSILFMSRTRLASPRSLTQDARLPLSLRESMGLQSTRPKLSETGARVVHLELLMTGHFRSLHVLELQCLMLTDQKHTRYLVGS